MEDADLDQQLGRHLASGDDHWRAYIGSPEIYDRLAANHFRLLTAMGLREHHRLLDIGAGSLRVGKLLLVYLLPGRYFAIEPRRELVAAGIRHEIGAELVALKEARFEHVDDFSCSRFGVQFDFLFAHSVFSHACRAQILTCLKEARKALAPTGLFLASWTPGDVDHQGDQWAYPQCIPYREDTLGALARDCGLEASAFDWETLIGQRWMCFYHPENREGAERAIASVRAGPRSG